MDEATTVENTEAQQHFEDQMKRYTEILPHTDPLLHKPCIPVDDEFVERDLMPLIRMLRMHMENRPGAAGLAANQIGSDRRVIMVRADQGLVVMINPVITTRRGRQKRIEHCLSVGDGAPGYAVPRAKRITIEFVSVGDDEEGKTFRLLDMRMTLKDFAAVVVQHEIDHLNGLSIVQRGKLVHEPPGKVS